MEYSLFGEKQWLILSSVCLCKSLRELYSGSPRGSDSKESACNVGDPGSIPGLGRCAGAGNGSPFQYSCLENSVERGAWQATVQRFEKSQKRLRDFHFHFQGIQSWKQDFQLLE